MAGANAKTKAKIVTIVFHTIDEVLYVEFVVLLRIREIIPFTAKIEDAMQQIERLSLLAKERAERYAQDEQWKDRESNPPFGLFGIKGASRLAW